MHLRYYRELVCFPHLFPKNLNTFSSRQLQLPSLPFRSRGPSPCPAHHPCCRSPPPRGPPSPALRGPRGPPWVWPRPRWKPPPPPGSAPRFRPPEGAKDFWMWLPLKTGHEGRQELYIYIYIYICLLFEYISCIDISLSRKLQQSLWEATDHMYLPYKGGIRDDCGLSTFVY